MNYLWQTAELTPCGGGWATTADRALGPAMGLLAPLVSSGEGWRVAADPQEVFILTEVDDVVLTPLPFATGSVKAEHHVCLLRYDHPEDRPGATFNAGVVAAQGVDGVALHGRKIQDNAATVAEVESVLQALLRQRRTGELEDRFVAAPDGAAAPYDPAQGFFFVFASCQYPAGMMDLLHANRSYRRLARLLRRPGQSALLQRILLLGDQVYTDATYGLLDPARLDDRFRMAYERFAAADGPLAQLPQDFKRLMHMTPDDHEIVDNWEPWRPGATGKRHYRGLDAYWRYQRGHEQPLTRVWDPSQRDATRGWHLFVGDSRSTREYRGESTIDTATILGKEQTRELEEWLDSAPRDDLKIVTTAAMLLPRTRVGVEDPLRLDNWQGYPASFHRLLAYLCEHRIGNVVFLGGDAHLGCSAEVTVLDRDDPQKTVSFQCLHAPALYAPYPFANETQWNLLLKDDRFRFEWPDQHRATRRYECRVSATVAGDNRNGCGLLHARRDGSGWKLATRFLLDKVPPGRR